MGALHIIWEAISKQPGIKVKSQKISFSFSFEINQICFKKLEIYLSVSHLQHKFAFISPLPKKTDRKERNIKKKLGNTWRKLKCPDGSPQLIVQIISNGEGLGSEQKALKSHHDDKLLAGKEANSFWLRGWVAVMNQQTAIFNQSCVRG